MSSIAFPHNGTTTIKLLLPVLLFLITSALSGLTTLYVEPGSTNVDLQNRINYALQDLGTETEAEIIIECSELTIQPDISLPDPNVNYTSLTVYFDTSALNKLSIRGLSAELQTTITLVQAAYSVTPTSIFSISGNTSEDKEVSFKYLNLEYSGTYADRRGIIVSNGFKRFEVDSCKFSQLGRGIDQGTQSISGTSVQNTIINSNEFYEPSGLGSGIEFSPFDLKFQGSSSLNPHTTKISITNNNISGFPKDWGKINICGYGILELVIADNHFSDSSDTSISAVLAVSSSNIDPVILNIRDNEFNNGSVSVQGLSGNITDNSFFTGVSRNIPYQLKLYPTTFADHISIKSNDFSGTSQTAVDILSKAISPLSGTLSTAIDQNSFFNSGTALCINTPPDYTNGPSIITSFKNNLIACNSSPFIVRYIIDAITLNPQVEVSHCFFLNTLPNHASFHIDPLTCLAGDPGIVLDTENHTYSLRWGETMRSPLILNGYYEGQINSSFCDKPDIGKVQYTGYPHEYSVYEFPAGNDRNGIKWMSFPSLDRLYGNEDMAFTFFIPLRNPSILSSIKWKLLDDPIENLTVLNEEWDGSNQTIQPQVGYKFQMNPSLQDPVYISTPAIKPDQDLPMTLIARTNAKSTIPDNENWLGYFGETTVHPYDAFAGVLDNLWYIQSQNWTLARLTVNHGSPWVGIAYSGCKPPTLKYGDMVIVKCFDDAVFTWNDEAPERDEFIKEKPSTFSFTEKMDYIPVYVEFNGTDIPKEAAVYLEGICKGAAVVGGNSVEIPAYILDDIGYGAELELRVYYDSKAAYNSIPRYKTWNPERGEFQNNTLSLSERKPYYMLKMDTGSINDTPAPKLYMGNYPNPFNPDTTLRFSLPGNADINLDIYNVKGQRVRSLINGSYNEGTHNCLWDAKDNTGNRVSSGIYFAVLSYQGNQLSRKLLLMK
jgi:hypothetical protein